MPVILLRVFICACSGSDNGGAVFVDGGTVTLARIQSTDFIENAAFTGASSGGALTLKGGVTILCKTSSSITVPVALGEPLPTPINARIPQASSGTNDLLVDGQIVGLFGTVARLEYLAKVPQRVSCQLYLRRLQLEVACTQTCIRTCYVVVYHRTQGAYRQLLIICLDYSLVQAYSE